MAVTMRVRRAWVEPKSVQRAVEKSAPQTLGHAGGYVRKVARNLIRQKKNPNVASPAGTPVNSHRNKSFGSNGIKSTILYGITPGRKSVVVGPALIRGGLSNVARIHEFGGRAVVRSVDPALRKNPKIGGIGPVREKYLAKRDVPVGGKNGVTDPKTGQRVEWIKLRTKSQKAASIRLRRRLMKTNYQWRFGKYPKRSYMNPAMMRSIPALSKFWVGAVRA